MSYTSYPIDVFVSYGHLDNRSSEESGWIDRFHRQLETRLAQWLGGEVSTWRDKKSITGPSLFEKEIEENLRRAAVLVPIVTPRFMNSVWCQRELHTFLDAAAQNGGLDVGTRRRVFKVLKTPVDLGEQPVELREMNGYQFFRIDDTGRMRELPDWDPDPNAGKRYLAIVDDVAHDIHVLLKSIRDRVKTAPSKWVYLAETTSDLTAHRDQIRRELSSQGYGILPERPLPDSFAELQNVVSESLSRSCLSVHMIGRTFGIVPEGDGETRSVTWIQRQLAADLQKNGQFPSILWVPPEVEATAIKDSRQRTLLEMLPGLLRDQPQTELLRMPFEGLKTHVLDRMKAPPKKEEPRPAVQTEQQQQLIYLICDSRDFDSVQSMQADLLNSGFEVVLPARDGTLAEMREYHEGMLQSCDAVLIYYGTGSEAWLGTKLVDLRRAMGLGRKNPFTAVGILIGPEPSAVKAGYQNPKYIVMHPGSPFSIQIAPFLDRLSRAKGAHG